MGDYFLEGLKAIRNNLIKDVRGRGLMLALEFREEVGGARRYCEALKDLGVLCKETHVSTIRFAPPLIITRDQVDWTLERIESVLVG
jgi:ornithine--oxo-acid transaminase